MARTKNTLSEQKLKFGVLPKNHKKTIKKANTIGGAFSPSITAKEPFVNEEMHSSNPKTSPKK